MTCIAKTSPELNNVSTVANVPDIIQRHWPDKDLAKFAKAAAADAFRKNYIRPADRNFVDRSPAYVGDLPAQPHPLSFLLREGR